MIRLIRSFAGLCAAIAVGGVAGLAFAHTAQAQTPSNGLIMLLEFEGIEGLRHWEQELDKRGLTALVQAQPNVMDKYPADFERMANKGYADCRHRCGKAVLGHAL